MPQELREEIKAMLVSELNLKYPPQEIADETPLFGPDSLGLDSIDALQIAVSLEKNYSVKLANSEAAREALASVNSIHDLVIANRQEEQ
ncbi:MAG: phosphopantetheine-binding protein, partial [Chthoniobacteraceae bacterium]